MFCFVRPTTGTLQIVCHLCTQNTIYKLQYHSAVCYVRSLCFEYNQFRQCALASLPTTQLRCFHESCVSHTFACGLDRRCKICFVRIHLKISLNTHAGKLSTGQLYMFGVARIPLHIHIYKETTHQHEVLVPHWSHLRDYPHQIST